MPDFIDRIDGFFEKLLSFPLEILCRWTGQDNYFFAAWMVVIGGIGGLISCGMTFFTESVVIGTLSLFMEGYAFLLVINLHTEFQERNDGTDALDSEVFVAARAFRLFLLGGSVLLLWFPSLSNYTLTNLVHYLLSPVPWWVISLYWLTDVHPRKRSLVRKAVVWLKNRLVTAPPVPQTSPSTG